MRAIPALATVTLAALLSACGGGAAPSPSPAADAAAREALVQGMACQGPAQTGWCWQRPLPWGNTVNAVRFIDPLHGVAVGEAGMVLRTTDGGDTWARVRQASHFESSLHTLQFADADHAWALGWDGALLRTVNGGQHWTAVDAGLGPGLLWSRLWVLDRQRLVVGPAQPARVSTDGGLTWRDSAFAPDVVTPSGVMRRFDPAGDLVSTDLGLNSARVAHNDGFDLFASTGGDGFVRYRAAGLSPSGAPVAEQMQVSQDGGLGWADVPVQKVQGLAIIPVLLSAQGRGWGRAQGFSGLPMFRTADHGLSWSAMALPPGRDADPSVIEFVLDSESIAGFVGPDIVYSGDGGAHWRILRVDGLRAAPSVDGAGGLVLASNGQTFHSRDGGATATLIPGGRPFTAGLVDLIGLHFFDLQRGIAVSAGDALLDTVDGGRTWTSRTMDSARCDADGLVQVGDGPAGVLRHCRGAGTGSGAAAEWAPLASPPENLSQVLLAGTGELWATSQRAERNGGGRDDPLACVGQLHHSTDGGRSWTVVPTRFGTQCLSLGLAPGGVLFAIARDSTGLWRSADAGATWTRSTTPGDAPSTASRFAFVDANRGGLVDGQRILTTRDGGLTWQASRVPALPTTQLRAVRFISAQHGWAVGDNGVVLSSTDGGESWTLQDSGSAANLGAVFALDADMAWVAGTGGTILVSRNGGR